jgi:hypothetical protein
MIEMRYIFLAWALPLSIFWGWYALSFYNINFGYIILTRQFHDTIFEIYGDILAINPEIIPGLLAKACILDTVLIIGIWAFRRRREIRTWLESRRSLTALPEAGRAPPAE